MSATILAPTRGPRGAQRSPWPGFLARRIASFAISLWLILTLVFFLARAVSGDAIRASSGLNADPVYVAARRAEFGLDDPLLVQYADFFSRVIRLDFGNSISTGQPVMSEIMIRLPYTIQLGLYAFLLAIIVALPVGLLMAVRTEGGRAKRSEAAYNAVTGFFAAVPDFLLAIGLVLVFAVNLRMLPAAGGEGLTAFILPVTTVAIGLVAVLSRLVKSEGSRVLREEYIRTARANNLPPAVVLGKHVLPNVLTAILTYAGMVLASLLGGTIITETVFAWPGIGSLLVKAIGLSDFTLLQGIVVIIAAFSLVITFLVDVLVALSDPKSLILKS